MKILALIPARGGSKRLPSKNKKLLNGKPLINWSIDIVKNIHEISDIVVSTDDPDIAEIAKNNGAMVPWLRPYELSTDSATSVDVALHALDWYESNKGPLDGLLLLQPTSPFRTLLTIQTGIKLFLDSGMKSVLAVSPMKLHPMLSMKVEDGVLRYLMDMDGLMIDNQAYIPNGSFYLIHPTELKLHRLFAPTGSLPLVIDKPEEALDIDTLWDWSIAEHVVERLLTA